jgi:hypothetical protein
MATRVNGYAAAALGAGLVIFWSGFTGKGILATAQSVIQGKSPQSNPAVNAPQDTAAAAAGAGGAPANLLPFIGAAGGGNVKLILQETAAAYGWTGAQWTALDNLEMQEAGYNPEATNSGTKAYGIGQALGHGTAGTQGTKSNMYGGFGVSDAVAQAANSGDAAAQAAWMCAYIKITYGDPVNAWGHEQSAGWY